MSVGTSGRIVLEVEPEFKKSLYALLDKEGLTLKQWFTMSATNYLAQAGQMSLFDAAFTATAEQKA
jgi:hypothetical protein